MNKKGFTTIELITSFSIASVIMLVLFNVIIIMKDNMSDINTKTNMLVAKDNLSYNINKRLKEKELTSLSMCEDGDKCYLFTYSDSTTDKLVYNTDSITFNNYTFEITDGITVDAPTITEHYDTMTSTAYNGYIIINIPITINNKDYSIKTVKHINSENTYVDIGNYWDNENNKYIVVEYIESTGTQYIDTLFKVNQDTRVVVDSEITDYFKTGYYQAIFGATTVSGSAETNRYTLHLSSSYKDIYIAYGNEGYRSNFGDVNKRNIYDLDKNTFKVNGSTIASTTQKTFQGTETLNIFRENNSNNQNNRYINMKLYSTKIYDNGVLIRDYIPVVDESSIPCLFDKLEKKCYYNQGTGEFIYPKNENEYTRVNYIESTGTQYIDTGIVANNNLSLKMDISYLSNSFQINGGLDRNANYDLALGINSEKWFFRFGDKSVTTQISADNNRHLFEISQNGAYIDNEKVADISTKIFNANLNMYIAARNTSTGIEAYCNEQIFQVQIYNESTIIRDFIPVIDSSSRPCLFDRVGKQCYYNQGEGEFLYG